MRSLILALCLLTSPVAAEVYEVKMLNRGDKGSMVFEPDVLQLQPGDSVRFRATHPSHNAASIPELWPAGTKTFMGKINEEIEITFTEAGFYGIRCVPHYTMGMAMLVRVGTTPVPDLPADLPKAAKERLQAALATVSR